ncbi:type II toxin-antitoxin system VapC family toxin [Arthrobacter sp. GCM10027362]|uniref:type II toxin-antitoxin system VapC family toxin n=1 Tax=Arthrobacter sp. GCM10027362 TaxID=3273379 RepID=UPI003638C35F
MSPQAGLLLDTAVVAELRRPNPHPAVVEFLRQRRHLRVYLSALTFGELYRLGRQDLQFREVEGWLDELRERFAANILPVDTAVAALWGPVDGRAGVSAVEALIAATALHKHLTVVSRNAENYRQLAVPAVDPWKTGQDVEAGAGT